MTLVAAAAAAASAFAADCKCGKECSCEGGENCTCSSDEFNYTPGEGLSYGEQPIVTAEFELKFDSKYMTYGVIDGKDPILTPSAYATFFDWVYFGVEAIFDVTKGNGKRGGYGNRAGKYTTLDSVVGIAHEFDLGETLGKLSVDFNYIYEYLPRYQGSMDDTQYLNLELSLGDLWLEPKLWIERDLMADEGTYVNLELGHGFKIEAIEGLTLRPSIAQGLGNSLRTKGYFSDVADGFSHGGLMDTTVKGELEYEFTDWLKFGAYVAYYDYLFDSNMRDAARAYNAQWGKSCDHSYNFVFGVSLKATF